MIRTLSKKIEQRVIDWIAVDRYLPLQVDITNACNLRCKHCYHPHHENSGAIGLADWLMLLKQYEALVRRLRFRPYVIVCGGEPFLSPHFEPILERILSRSPSTKLAVLTNGTYPDPQKVALLSRFQDLAIQVSLDGPNDEAHDSVRGKGSFARSQFGIRQFQKSGLSVDLLAVLSRRTSPCIGEFFDLAHSLSVAGMGFTRLIEMGQAQSLVASNEDRALSSLELRAAYRKIIEESARTGVRTGTSSPLFRLVHPSLGRNGRFEEGIVIDYKGRYLASSRSRLVLGDALKEGMENIFLRHPTLRSLRRREIRECGTCPYFTSCGGDRNAAYAHSGDFLGPDPGCWLKKQGPKIA